MSETAGNKSSNEKDVKKTSHCGLVAYLSALLLCCGLYGFAIYLHNGHIIEGQNRIIRTYARQMEKMESTKAPMSMREIQRENELKAFHQEVKSLLELEFNRIQNEFEAIEIWTGILTVIFLIFSFYSLFKTEQLENQSRDELSRIKKISEDGETKLGAFDNDSKKALSTLKSSVDEIKKGAEERIDGLLKKGQSDVLNDFDKRAKEILETYKSKLEELVDSNQASIEKSYDLYLKKLQSIIEKDSDLGDLGEIELDEEELKNNQGDEEKEG